MKKLLPLLTTLTLASISQADMVRIHAGAGGWNQNPTGTFKNGVNTIDVIDTLGYGSDTNIYAWAYFKHFIPIVPNVRVEATQSNFSGEAKVDFSFDGTDYTQGTLSTLQIKQYDAVLYYNILDNTIWTTIDLGLDFKYLQFNATLNNDTINDESFVLPLLYARARVQVPTTGLAFELDAKAVTIDASSMSDIRAKVQYSFDTPVLQPGIEIGYRQERMNISSGSTLPVKNDIDITFGGIYAGITLSF